MNIRIHFFLLLLLLQTATAAAQQWQLSELSPTDRQYMQQQRDSIDSLARRHLGRQLNGTRDNDLAILQRLLERRLVRNDDRQALQALGIVLGDVLQRELQMHWVIYEDKVGRSRSLRLGNTDNFLFPVSMISRRAEAGIKVDVAAVYQKAVDAIQPHRPALPYQ